MTTDVQKLDLDENTVLKECIGCGTEFVVFEGMEDDNHFCSPACEEAHSIFNYQEE